MGRLDDEVSRFSSSHSSGVPLVALSLISHYWKIIDALI
jgi:hypothetical protein